MGNKIFFGLALVVLGVVLLLVNLGYFSPGIIFRLFHLWPLILVIIGINILFRKSKFKTYITWISWIAFFSIVIVYSLFGSNPEGSRIIDDRVVIEKLEETEFGKFDLDIGASTLNINSTDTDLLVAEISGRELNYRKDFSNHNQLASIKFYSKEFNIIDIQNEPSRYDFYLNKDVVWDLDVDLGAMSGKMDLGDVPVRSLDLDSGAVDLALVLSDKHDTKVSIDSGASNLSIEIPKSVGLKIKMDTALSSTNIDDLGLVKDGDYYTSTNYDTAKVRIDMDIDMGVGNIDFVYWD